VAFDPATLFAGDAVAQLSAAISMRMAPPPPPASDRTYAAVGWLAGSLVGLAAWVLGVWQAGGWLPFTAVVGGSMVAFGVAWRAYLSGRGRGAGVGLFALVPPLCLVNLFRPAAGVALWPLGFVVSGGALLGLFAAGEPVGAWVNQMFEVTPTPMAIDVQAAATRLQNKDDREAARRALVRAGAAAEPAVLRLLGGKPDATVLAACDVLAEVGTAESVPALRKLADETVSKAVRLEATAAADAIEKRLGK
jgi:hypothetical protein